MIVTSSLPDTNKMSGSVSSTQQHEIFLCQLGNFLNQHKESELFMLIDFWNEHLVFKRGSLYQLLYINASNLEDAFNYKFTNKIWLPRNAKRTTWCALNLWHSANSSDWLDQWAAVVVQHLDNLTTTWMQEYLLKDSDDENDDEEEEDDIDGPIPWPPALLDHSNWFTTTVGSFQILENGFDALDNIFALQKIDEENEHYQDFCKHKIEKPLSQLKRMRELLVSSPSVSKEESKLAWCIFAEMFLNSAVKLQNVVLYSE